MLRQTFVALLFASMASAGLVDMFRGGQGRIDESMEPYAHGNFGAICSFGEAEADEFCRKNAGQFLECVQYSDDEDPYWIPPALAALFFGKKPEPKAGSRLLLEPGRCLCPTDFVLAEFNGAENETIAIVTELEYDMYDRECYIKPNQPCRILDESVTTETNIPRCIWTANCIGGEDFREDFGICSGAGKVIGSAIIMAIVAVAQLY